MIFINMSVIVGLLFLLAGNADASGGCATASTSSLTVNVKDKGAKGNGVADDTFAIQATIDQVSGSGGTVFVPSGIYMIDAVRGIQIKGAMTLRMSKDAVLKARPNDKGNYSIINIANASNVNVINGTLIGERDEHFGNKGEWGMGITLRGATNIVIEGVVVKKGWGDGFYIAGASKNIKFCSVTADNNRRQGMSVISVNGMIVKDSVFKNTGGTPPAAGIDFEPNQNDVVSNVQVSNSKFMDNQGLGVLITSPLAGNGVVKNITFEKNTVSGNRGGGIGIYNTSGHKITSNSVKNNQGFDIFLSKDAKGNTVSGNRLGALEPTEN